MTRRYNYPLGDDNAVWRQDLDRRLAALERSAQLGNAAIGSGGLTIRDGGELRFVDGSGTTVVALSAAGLDSTTVQQASAWIDEDFDADTTATITETEATLAGVTIAPPSWVNTLIIQAVASVHINQGPAAPAQNHLVGLVRIDGTDSPEYISGGPQYTSGLATLINLTASPVFSRTISSPGASIDVLLRGYVDSDVDSILCEAAISVLAIGTS
jgi:hypothetical protein